MDLDHIRVEQYWQLTATYVGMFRCRYGGTVWKAGMPTSCWKCWRPFATRCAQPCCAIRSCIQIMSIYGEDQCSKSLKCHSLWRCSAQGLSCFQMWTPTNANPEVEYIIDNQYGLSRMLCRCCINVTRRPFWGFLWPILCQGHGRDDMLCRIGKSAETTCWSLMTCPGRLHSLLLHCLHSTASARSVATDYSHVITCQMFADKEKKLLSVTSSRTISIEERDKLALSSRLTCLWRCLKNWIYSMKEQESPLWKVQICLVIFHRTSETYSHRTFR